MDRSCFLITGAAGGLGTAICKKLSETYDLIAVDIKKTDYLAELEAQGKVNFIKADITDSECIEQLKKEVTNKYKSINGMILAAGILEVKNFKNTTLEDWNRTLEINLTANYMICKALVDNIIACGGGHIIFIGSVMSKVAGYDLLTYSVSKAGVAHLAANLALDLLNEEIYVNCICPGFMNTEMYQKVNQAPEKNINWIHTLAGLKNKFVRIEDIVNLIYFLINQQSINGQAIIVDNGYSIR